MAPSFKDNYYDRLGLSPTHDARLIRRQFRLLARLFHPDINDAPEAQQRFMELQEAYNVLSNEDSRRTYEAWLSSAALMRQPLQLDFSLYPAALVRAHGKQRAYALLDLTVDNHGHAGNAPLNVILVLDRSSSMKGRRLHYVKEATRRIVDQLGPRDIFGLVTFNDRATVVLPAGRGTERTVAHSAIASIEATGGTELATGMHLGLTEALKFHSSQALSHIILLTDGRTFGDEPVALEIAARAGQQGIGVTGFGLGTDWNDEFLDELTRQANGSSHFIAQPDQALSLFQSQLQQLQQTVARNARLELELGPGVELLQAHEISPGLHLLGERDGAIQLGGLPAEPPKRLLLEFAVSLPNRDVALLARLTLKGQLMNDTMLYRSERLAVIEVGDEAAALPGAPIYDAAKRVATLRMQNRTWESIARGDSSQTAAALEHLAQRFLEIGAEELARSTEYELSHYQQTGAISATGLKFIKYGTRMLSLPSPPSEGK